MVMTHDAGVLTSGSFTAVSNHHVLPNTRKPWSKPMLYMCIECTICSMMMMMMMMMMVLMMRMMMMVMMIMIVMARIMMIMKINIMHICTYIYTYWHIYILTYIHIDICTYWHIYMFFCTCAYGWQIHSKKQMSPTDFPWSHKNTNRNFGVEEAEASQAHLRQDRTWYDQNATIKKREVMPLKIPNKTIMMKRPFWSFFDVEDKNVVREWTVNRDCISNGIVPTCTNNIHQHPPPGIWLQVPKKGHMLQSTPAWVVNRPKWHWALLHLHHPVKLVSLPNGMTASQRWNILKQYWGPVRSPHSRHGSEAGWTFFNLPSFMALSPGKRW